MQRDNNSGCERNVSHKTLDYICLSVKNIRLIVFVAGLIVFIEYPFKHLYSYHSVVGNIPRFMDGKFGWLMLTALIVFSLYFMMNDFNYMHRNTALIFIVFSFFIYISISWIIIHRILGFGLIASPELTIYYLRLLISYIVIFFAGFYLRLERWGKIYIFSFLAILVSVMLNVYPGSLMIDLRQVVDPADLGIYLSLSTTALFTGLFAWAAVKTEIFRVLILGAIAVALFFIGSRADFASYLIVLPIALWLTARPIIQFVLYSIVTITLTGFMTIAGMEKILASRQLQLITFNQFTSLSARNTQLLIGLDRIQASPIFGYYGGTLEIFGPDKFDPIGSYIHNILSVWESFGLIPFLLYLFLAITCLLFAFAFLAAKGRKMDQHLQMIVIVCIIVFIEVATAKSMGWHHIALAWGMVAGWWQNNKNNRYDEMHT